MNKYHSNKFVYTYTVWLVPSSGVGQRYVTEVPHLVSETLTPKHMGHKPPTLQLRVVLNATSQRSATGYKATTWPRR